MYLIHFGSILRHWNHIKKRNLLMNPLKIMIYKKTASHRKSKKYESYLLKN